LTLLQASGGTFRWRSAGTITRVELAGEAHFWNEYDLPKTLAAMSVYDSAVAYLRDSHHLTLTTGIRQFGNASAMLGRGETAGVV
jgi:hypothetical protein